MGNAASAVGIVEDEPGGEQPVAGTGRARLYAYDVANAKWTVAKADTVVEFTKSNSEGDTPDWHLEARARLVCSARQAPAQRGARSRHHARYALAAAARRRARASSTPARHTAC
jgi:hypothetical protein